jgi:hypothetical protein
MLSCVWLSSDGYFALSKSNSCCVRLSKTDIFLEAMGSSRSTDETDEVEDVRCKVLSFLCRIVEGGSTGSKIGLRLVEDDELAASCSDDIDGAYSCSKRVSNSSCVLNFPP